MHETRGGATVVLAGGAFGFLTAGHSVEGVGALVRFPAPVPIAQLVPLVLAVGAALLLTYRVDRRALIAPTALRRLRTGRAGWATAVLLGVVLVASSGLLRGAASEGPRVISNLLLLTGLAVFPVAWGRPEYAWLAPTALVLTAAVYGAPSQGEPYYWWASCLTPTVGPVGWIVSAAIALAGLGLYVFEPRSMSRRPERTSTSSGVRPW